MTLGGICHRHVDQWVVWGDWDAHEAGAPSLPTEGVLEGESAAPGEEMVVGSIYSRGVDLCEHVNAFVHI